MKAISYDKTILVVDDEVDLCEILQFELEDSGYSVVTASQVSQAVAVLESKRIDLVISDICMPGGDGIELLQSVRKQSKDQPPFLFISGYSEHSVAEAYEAGVQGFLQKPLSSQHLTAAVSLALKEPEQRWDQKQSAIPHLHFARTFASLAAAENEQGFVLGRGGFSMILGNENAGVESTASFSFHFAEEGISLEGEAVCRWRSRSQQRRVGFEITYLTAESHQFFRRWRESSSRLAFIPL